MNPKGTKGNRVLKKADVNHRAPVASDLFETDGRVAFVTTAVVKSGEFEFINETFRISEQIDLVVQHHIGTFSERKILPIVADHVSNVCE